MDENPDLADGRRRSTRFIDTTIPSHETHELATGSATSRTRNSVACLQVKAWQKLPKGANSLSADDKAVTVRILQTPFPFRHGTFQYSIGHFHLEATKCLLVSVCYPLSFGE